MIRDLKIFLWKSNYKESISPHRKKREEPLLHAIDSSLFIIQFRLTYLLASRVSNQMKYLYLPHKYMFLYNITFNKMLQPDRLYSNNTYLFVCPHEQMFRTNQFPLPLNFLHTVQSLLVKHL